MSEPVIRIQQVVDPRVEGVTVEKESPRGYVVLSPRKFSMGEALIAVSRADPDGSMAAE